MAPPHKDDTQNSDFIGNADWRNPNRIWAFSPSINSARDTANSRGSDEVSPTAASGSVPLIQPISEKTTWGSKPWQVTNNMTPTSTRNNLSNTFNDGNNNHDLYPARHSISQGTSIPSRSFMPPGPVESPPSSRFKASGNTLPSEERPSEMFFGPTAHFSDASLGRRKSADPGSLGVGYNRTGTLSGRQHEANPLTLGSQFGDPTSYSLSKALQSNSEHRRPSFPQTTLAPPSLSSETSRSQTLNFSNDPVHAELNDAFSRGLKIEDASESLNNFQRNGDYQFPSNHNAQTWQHDTTNGSTNSDLRPYQDGWNGDAAAAWRHYPGLRHRTTPEVWADPTYLERKPGSVERASPAGSSHRPNINSSRNLSGTPSSRNNSWNQSVPRNPNLPQDIERQLQGSQYPHQPSGYQQYFMDPYLAPYTSPFDHFAQQASTYRQPAAAGGYGLPMNYHPNFGLQTSRNKDPAQNARSQRLEEFRASLKTSKRWELKDIYGHVVEFSGDQHGSRFIQDKLSVVNSEEKDRVFSEVEPNALQLMKDVFGNYVIQKFFEHGTQSQKKFLGQQMLGKVADLSVQMYSCRVVQKALEHVLDDQQKVIINELRPDVVRVAKDQNGNHVIQKIIESFPKQCIPFVMEAFQGQIPQLATHNYACRVIQRILESGTPDEKKKLMDDIHKCTTKLLTDQYGNYVIQHVIMHGQLEDRRIMIEQVIERALVLSKHKFASNVVEKCIEFGSSEQRSAIRTKLTTPTATMTANNDGLNPLQGVMKDQYGNYVIQMMIKHLEGAEQQAFAQEVSSHVPQLKRQNAARANTGLEKLYILVDQIIPPKPDTNGNSAAAVTSPSTPAVLTPPLTTEQNSPQSSSPPSTSISTTDEAGEDSETAPVSRLNKAPPVVRLGDN
ncbi:ARM repeat-containing protein [Xylaria bambusicola]|uniref:ARM repeat-containing protein n=1 Tax=Xylaria bambusicola TaxID=326684 RepID=UPI002008113C|nr:ARM repeat-containing protein [Xylaria bambusicola]KAI0527894.1 ARM repeat-containing protein [Xylaria bambusicola]